MIGKAGFDIFSQAFTKGSFDKIDWSDAAVTGLMKNTKFKNLIKAFVDTSSEEGLKLKSLQDGLSEFGLRLINETTLSEENFGSGKMAIDIVKKVVLSKEKEIINHVKSEINEEEN